MEHGVGVAMLQSLVVVACTGQWGRGIEEQLSPRHREAVVCPSCSVDSCVHLGLGPPTFLLTPFPFP